MPTVDVAKVVAFLNLDERRIQQLVHEGMPRETRGQYDPIKCALWYIRYLQRALQKKSVPTLNGGFVGEREERVRLLRADADLRERELAGERARLVALPDVEQALSELANTARIQIMAIPPRLAPELVGETSRVMIQAKIEKACKEALSCLAKGEKMNSDSRQSKKANFLWHLHLRESVLSTGKRD